MTLRIPTAIAGLSEPETLTVQRLLEPYARVVGSWRLATAETILATEPRLVLLGGMDDLPRALTLRTRLVQEQLVVLVLGDSTSPEALRQAIHAGCRELIHPARDLDVLLKLACEIAHNYTAELEVAGNIVAVLGSHGGSGTTTIALSVAHLLAQDPTRRVVYVDLDEAGGDVRAVLGFNGAATTLDLLRLPEEVDAGRIREAIDRAVGGFWVLAHPEETAQTEPTTDADAHALLGRLRRLFTHIVFDLGPVLHGAQRQIIAESTSVLLITEQQAEPLRVAIRRMDIIRGLGLDDEHVHLIVNRYEPDRRPALEELAAHLGRRPAAIIASDHERVRAANADGLALTQFDPESAIARDMVNVCATLGGAVPSAVPAKKPWWKVW